MHDFQKNIPNNSSLTIIKNGFQSSQSVSQPLQTQTLTLLQTNGTSSQLNILNFFNSKSCQPCHDCYFDQTIPSKTQSQQQQSWLTNQYNLNSVTNHDNIGSKDFDLFDNFSIPQNEQNKKTDFQLGEYMRHDIQNTSSPLTPLDSTNLCDVENDSSEMYSLDETIITTDNVDQIHWCKIVAPILWQAPNPGFKKSKFLVRTYLLCLPQDVKRSLKQNNIPVPPAPRRCLPAFDYPFFLKKITDKFISRLTEAWLFKKWSVDKVKATSHLNLIFHNLFFSRAQRITSLTFDDDAPWPFVDQPLSCLKYLSFLKISASNHSDNNPIPFLNSLLISSCSRIKIIEIDIDSKYLNCNDSIIKLILSQHDLQKISLNKCHQILKPLAHVLKSSLSLKSLRFNRVNFDSFKEIFDDSFINSLKSIELIICQRLDNKFFKNFLCKAHNLSQFEFCDYNSIDPYILDLIISLLTLNNNLKCLILRISGDYSDYSDLVGTISKQCKNLEYLELPQIRKFDILTILTSCLYLKYFYFIIDFSLDRSFFLQIAKQLPKDLKNLIITEREKRPAFDIFTYKLFFNSMNSKNLKTLYTSGALLDHPYSLDYQKIFLDHNIKWSYEEIPRLY
ncbi:21108_t:CDS:2 [Cetraspora pellucida]|uniref:21108_t:CDS:1 n=1 Tax=Cetraspora pellucida TaxID=1433469 RepID=A0A9N9CNX2_9GLOM|nr:21108_t:CDS:2 [Cetraspora pellucida]